MPAGSQERVDLEIHREIELSQGAAVCEPYRVVQDDGTEVDPTGGAVTAKIYAPAGAEITTSGALTAAISGKLISLSFNTTKAGFALGENYRCELTLTAGAVAYRRWFYFDVVAFRVPCLLSGDHFPPDLRPSRGEADFSRIIQAARAQVHRDLRRSLRRGSTERLEKVRAALLRNPEDLFEVQRHHALYLAYLEAFGETGDRYHALAKEHFSLYEKALKVLLEALAYDENQDRALADEEATHLRRGPFFTR